MNKRDLEKLQNGLEPGRHPELEQVTAMTEPQGKPATREEQLEMIRAMLRERISGKSARIRLAPESTTGKRRRGPLERLFGYRTATS